MSGNKFRCPNCLWKGDAMWLIWKIGKKCCPKCEHEVIRDD